MVPMPASPNEPAAGERSSMDVLVAAGTVSIWVGRFGEEDALYDYVDFRYPSDGGWSPFTRNHGLDWVDEDFAEAAWWREPYSFADHSYGDSFAPQADADLAQWSSEVNSAYLLYDIDARQLPRSETSPLTFLGAYHYRK